MREILTDFWVESGLGFEIAGGFYAENFPSECDVSGGMIRFSFYVT